MAFFPLIIPAILFFYATIPLYLIYLLNDIGVKQAIMESINRTNTHKIDIFVLLVGVGFVVSGPLLLLAFGLGKNHLTEILISSISTSVTIVVYGIFMVVVYSKLIKKDNFEEK